MCGYIFLFYYPGSWVNSLLLLLLLSSFLCFPSISAKKSATALDVMKTIIYGVWFFRNKTTFRNIKNNHRAIIRFVSSDISSRVHIDFHRLSSSRFLDQWSFPPFVYVSNGLLNVNI